MERTPKYYRPLKISKSETLVARVNISQTNSNGQYNLPEIYERRYMSVFFIYSVLRICSMKICLIVMCQ